MVSSVGVADGTITVNCWGPHLYSFETTLPLCDRPLNFERGPKLRKELRRAKVKGPTLDLTRKILRLSGIKEIFLFPRSFKVCLTQPFGIENVKPGIAEAIKEVFGLRTLKIIDPETVSKAAC